MDLQPQPSFIPKRPLMAGTAQSGSAPSIVWLVAVFIFIVSVLAAVAVFLYTFYLQHEINVKQQSLGAAQAAYDPNSITDLVRLSERIAQAGQLLKQHVAPSAIFTYLENNTLSTVRFNQFSYTSNTDGTVSLKLSGNAVDFASVALQSDQLGATSSPLKNVEFSGVNIDPSSGVVGFEVNADYDPAQILYASQLNVLSQSTTGSSTTQ